MARLTPALRLDHASDDSNGPRPGWTGQLGEGVPGTRQHHSRIPSERGVHVRLAGLRRSCTSEFRCR